MVQVPSEQTSKCRLMESTKRQISREKARHDARAERSGGGGRGGRIPYHAHVKQVSPTQGTGGRPMTSTRRLQEDGVGIYSTTTTWTTTRRWYSFDDDYKDNEIKKEEVRA